MIVKRYEHNPVVSPSKKRMWQAAGAFNGCPVEYKGETYLLYRALSTHYYHNYPRRAMSLSTVGIAKSSDAFTFSDHKKFITPKYEWERFGCEDPRITKIGSKYYIFYTALSKYPFEADGIKVAVAITKDLQKIEEKHPVTPFNAKAMCLFPEKINGKYWVIFSLNTDRPPTEICLASFDKESDLWSKEKWDKWYKNHANSKLHLIRREDDHVEVGAPPIKTKHGWLVLYSYITDYKTDKPVFGVEAALLDLKNPKKVIAKSVGPFIVPEEYYELYGTVPNIVFPTGVLKKGKDFLLYYGGADTTTCVALINSESALKELQQPKRLKELKAKKAKNNPIITPIGDHDWENFATCNPAAIYLDGKVHILYRAMGRDNTSVMGYATSKDGITIDMRFSKPAYVPREDFEMKGMPNANSGCEDPRLTVIDDKIYMFYTAFNSVNLPRVAFTWITKDDFLQQKWDAWAKPILASPAETDNKDACIFPEKINGKYYIFHRTGTGIDLSAYSNLDFREGRYLEETKWMHKRKGWWDQKKIGISAPPIKTKKGWVVLYHGISRDNSYHMGAFLVDLQDPFKLLARTDTPLLSPEEPYEKEGIVGNVVFPCGAVQIKDTLFIYYGGADKVVGVATIKLKDLLDKFDYCKQN